MSDTDMKDDVMAEMMAFSAKPSEVAPSEASSRKRKLKAAPTTGPMKKRQSKPTVQMIEGPERQQLISPLATSPVMQTNTTTTVPCPVELECADNASAVSYISSHNT